MSTPDPEAEPAAPGTRPPGPEPEKAVNRGETQLSLSSELAPPERNISEAELAREAAELRRAPVQYPDRRYGVIVADPPWDLRKIEREVAPEQRGWDYPTMPAREIARMPVDRMALPDCWLFLWTTHRHLPQAFEIVARWGFKYRWCMVWAKNSGFQPWNFARLNCEFCLVAVRGSPQLADAKGFNALFHARSGAHSVKPQAFYDTVRRVTGEGRRLDLFGRRAIPGFDSWGNQAPAQENEDPSERGDQPSRI